MNRFILEHDFVVDTQTGLMWPRDAALAGFPLTWNEGFRFVDELNRANQYGYNEVRLATGRFDLEPISVHPETVDLSVLREAKK